MKNKIIYGILVAFALLSGCAEDPELAFEETNRIYFENYTYNSLGNKVALDSILYSFGEESNEVTSHQVNVVVRFAGRLSKQERTYRVVVADTSVVKQVKTNMKAGEDYVAFSEKQIFRAESWTDTLRLVVNRDYLDKSFRKQLNKRLILRLEPSDDFDVEVAEASEMVVVTNDYLTEPTWWEGMSAYLFYYHPEKLKVLISFDKRFAVKDALAVTAFEVENKYADMLRKYLDEAKIIDEDDGIRQYIYMEKPEPVE